MSRITQRLRQAWHAFNQASKAEQNLLNKYSSWWTDNVEPNFWFERFSTFHKLPSAHFISCFGKRGDIKLSATQKNIFFSVENLQDRYTHFHDHMLNEVDFGLGFEYRSESNYLRFPLWLIYNTNPESNDPGGEFERALNRQWSADRPIFCAQVASHDERGNGHGLRVKCSACLSEIGTVLNGGKLLKNSDLLQKRYVDVVDYLLRDTQFNICLENSIGDGYITEKIFRPLVAGSIPIYWGVADPELEVISSSAFLRFDPKNPRDLIQEVKTLHSSLKLRQKFLNTPKIQPQARDWINEKHESLKRILSD